jgi:hypothetical protein
MIRSQGMIGVPREVVVFDKRKDTDYVSKYVTEMSSEADSKCPLTSFGNDLGLGRDEEYLCLCGGWGATKKRPECRNG